MEESNMHGLISQEVWNEIDNKLPSLDTKRIGIATRPNLDINIIDLLNITTVGSGLVACNDAMQRWTQARLALREAYACEYWYSSEGTEPNELIQVLSTRFYLDYIPLLLYSSVEDIADCIQNVWDITPLKDISGKSSRAIQIGKSLMRDDPQGQLAKAVSPFSDNDYWKFTTYYRNQWVHEQPPLITGLGIQIRRDEASPPKDNPTNSMYFGGGSQPQYSISELFEKNLGALLLTKTLIDTITELIIAERESLGTKFDFESGSTVITLF